MPEHGTATPTDPVYGYLVAALFVVLGAITLYVLVDSVLRVLIRRVQQARAERRWCADVIEGRTHGQAIGGGLR